MNEMSLNIVEAFLSHRWSHRRIQSEIMHIAAPVRGGGFEAMKALHSFGITGEYKGALSGRSFNKELFRQTRSVRRYLAAIDTQ